MHALLTALAIIAPSSVAQQPALPDRSGEAAFRELLRTTGKLRSLYIEDYKSRRLGKDAVLRPLTTYDLYYSGPEKFRIFITTPDDHSLILVNSGATLLSESLGHTDSALFDGVKNVYEAPAFKVNELGVCVMFYLLGGETSFNILVDKSSPITAGTGWVSFRSKDLGAVKIEFSGRGEAERVNHIEFDAPTYFEWWQDQHLDSGEKLESPLLTEDLYYYKGPLAESLFNVTPPPGYHVVDQRKKKR